MNDGSKEVAAVAIVSGVRGGKTRAILEAAVRHPGLVMIVSPGGIEVLEPIQDARPRPLLPAPTEGEAT